MCVTFLINLLGYMFLECACDVGPDLLEVLLPVFWEECGKGALFSERVSHVSWLELLDLPMVDSFIIPCCRLVYKKFNNG